MSVCNVTAVPHKCHLFVISSCAFVFTWGIIAVYLNDTQRVYHHVPHCKLYYACANFKSRFLFDGMEENNRQIVINVTNIIPHISMFTSNMGGLLYRMISNNVSIMKLYYYLIYDLRSLFKIRARDWSKSITCVLVTWQQRVV